MARADLREGLHDQVIRSLAAGARLVLGGQPLPGPGNFYPVTLLLDVGPGMACWDEELFGPVACVRVVDDEDEAFLAASEGPYGLGASVWSAAPERLAGRLATMSAGCVFVNGMVKSDVRLPFGGTGDSGWGKELGPPRPPRAHALAHRVGGVMSGALPRTVDELLEDFELFDTWEDRYAYLVDLGKRLPGLSDAEKTDEAKVRGCTSQVWFVRRPSDDGRLRWDGDSDAIIVRGLVALLRVLTYGRTPRRARRRRRGRRVHPARARAAPVDEPPQRLRVDGGGAARLGPVTSLDGVARALTDAGAAVKRDEPLARKTWWRVGGPADVFVEVSTAGAAPHAVAGGGRRGGPAAGDGQRVEPARGGRAACAASSRAWWASSRGPRARATSCGSGAARGWCSSCSAASASGGRACSVWPASRARCGAVRDERRDQSSASSATCWWTWISCCRAAKP
jgi:sulfur transfer protein SufE